MARRPRDPPDGPHRTKNRGPSGPVTVSEDVTSVSPPRRDRDGAGLPDQGLIDVKRTLTTPQKLAATVTVLATAGALTAGAFASWQSTDSQHQDVGAAIVDSTMTAPGGEDWADIDVRNVLPGNTITRYATLTNTGSIEQTFTLTTRGATNDLTASETGMQVKIQACTVAWVDDDCVIGAGATLTTPRTLAYITDAGLASSGIVLREGGVTFLRVDFALPSDAGTEFQGMVDTFQVVEVGVPTDNGNQVVHN